MHINIIIDIAYSLLLCHCESLSLSDNVSGIFRHIYGRRRERGGWRPLYFTKFFLFFSPHFLRRRKTEIHKNFHHDVA